MKELNDPFQNLYKNFILRDLLSFIIPGAIIIVPLFFPHAKQSIKSYLGYNNSLSFPEGAALAILLFGLFFIVGFAVQCLGAEVLKILIFYYERNFPPNDNQSTPEVYCNLGIEIGQFDSVTLKSRLERFTALKQMCGNCSLALLISGIYLQIYYLYGNLYLLPSVVLVAIMYCYIAISFLYKGASQLKLPDGVKFPEDLQNKIRYDNFQQILFFRGIMSDEEKKALLKLPSENPYEKAIHRLFQRSRFNENNRPRWALLALLTIVFLIYVGSSICTVPSDQSVLPNQFIAFLSVSMQILSLILLYGHYVHVERHDTYMLEAIKKIRVSPKRPLLLLPCQRPYPKP